MLKLFKSQEKHPSVELTLYLCEYIFFCSSLLGWGKRKKIQIIPQCANSRLLGEMAMQD